MERVDLSDAEGRLGDLVDRASRGEEIQIVSGGETVARIAPPKRPIPPVSSEPFDWEAWKVTVSKMTPQTESAGDFIRRMRDSDPY